MTLPLEELSVAATAVPVSPGEEGSRWWAGNSIAARLARGIGWSVFAAAGSRAIALGCSIGLARILGREHYGELGVIQTTITTFQVFAAFGLGLTASKFMAELRHTDPSRAGRIAALSGATSAFTGAVVAVIMILSAGWLATHTLNAPQLARVLRIGAAALFLTSVNSAQMGALSGLEDFKSVAKLNLAGAALSFPFSLLGAWMNGIEGAIWGQCIGLVGMCVLSAIEVRSAARRSQISVNYREWWKELRVLIGFSLPATLGSLLVAPVNWACMAILAHRSDGYTQLGIFNASNQWRSAILFLPALLSSVAMPILSNLYGQRDKRRFVQVLRYNLALSLGSTLIIATAIVAASPWIMYGYGSGFSGGVAVLLPLAISSVFTAGLGIVGDAIASSGRMWDGFMLNLIWAIAMLAAAYLLIPRYGAVGFGWATVVAYCIHFITVTSYTFLMVRRLSTTEGPERL